MPTTASWTLRLEPEHDRALVHLVAGLTDRASAHRLGVSERTVQRRIRELMRWSASANRMQLGRNAALADIAVLEGLDGSAGLDGSDGLDGLRGSLVGSDGLDGLDGLRGSIVPEASGPYGFDEHGSDLYVPDPCGFGSEPAFGVRAPDAEALRLLRLLLADAAADRLLNLSPRSVERRVRELMTLAGARSRAQLGWRATRRGWI